MTIEGIFFCRLQLWSVHREMGKRRSNSRESKNALSSLSDSNRRSCSLGIAASFVLPVVASGFVSDAFNCMAVR
jgi:hypothetical protein